MSDVMGDEFSLSLGDLVLLFIAWVTLLASLLLPLLNLGSASYSSIAAVLFYSALSRIDVLAARLLLVAGIAVIAASLLGLVILLYSQQLYYLGRVLPRDRNRLGVLICCTAVLSLLVTVFSSISVSMYSRRLLLTKTYYCPSSMGSASYLALVAGAIYMFLLFGLGFSQQGPGVSRGKRVIGL